MKALVLKQFGGTENFSMEEISEPQVGKGEVLIQVKAIGINPVDVKTRAGGGQAAQYKENQPIVIGWDVAGIVTKAADDVTGFAVGDEVFGTINFPGTGGAYAPVSYTHLDVYKRQRLYLRTGEQNVYYHRRTERTDKQFQ